MIEFAELDAHNCFVERILRESITNCPADRQQSIRHVTFTTSCEYVSVFASVRGPDLVINFIKIRYSEILIARAEMY